MGSFHREEDSGTFLPTSLFLGEMVRSDADRAPRGRSLRNTKKQEKNKTVCGYLYRSMRPRVSYREALAYLDIENDRTGKIAPRSGGQNTCY